MALEDKDIFAAVCKLYPGQSIEFIMEQYAKAKLLNMKVEENLNTSEEAPEEKVEEIDIIPAEAPKKKWTRRMLKVKPEDAITDKYIACCCCGEERQVLTAKHIGTHDLTVEEYKKLCGYDQNQPLMSRQRYRKTEENVAKMREARKEKREAEVK